MNAIRATPHNVRENTASHTPSRDCGQPRTTTNEPEQPISRRKSVPYAWHKKCRALMECPSLEEFYCYPGSDSRLNQTTALSPTEFCLGKVYVFIQRYRVELVTPTSLRPLGGEEGVVLWPVLTSLVFLQFFTDEELKETKVLNHRKPRNNYCHYI